MKKIVSVILVILVFAAVLSGRGSSTSNTAALSGSVSTNGSTSMEKVIGILSEQFMADNSGVTVTYDASFASVEGQDSSSEAEQTRQQLRDSVSGFVRATLNCGNSITIKTLTVMEMVCKLDGLTEQRPDMFGALPQDVKLGIQAAKVITGLAEDSRLAVQTMTGFPYPSDEETKELYREVAMERYLNALLEARQNVAGSAQNNAPVQEHRHQMNRKP